MTTTMTCLTMTLCLCGLLPVCLADDAESDAAFVRQRKELAQRKRRIVLNNDGCDVLYFPKDKEPTPEEFLALRTSPLAGTHVDTVFYCTISSGFSNFTHDTKVGHVLARDMPFDDKKSNITKELIEQGNDALKLVVDFCHEHGMEAFWSMRMNDTHDGAHRPDKPYPLFPPLKNEHPEYMIGSFENRPKHGAWTSVDYTLPEIRELAFRYIEEVCRNYDVDGVELDFFRHLSYFKSVAFGANASEAELDMMTDLLRRVRKMADARGRERGRPILIAIRVPDSVEFCRGLGFDLERWLSEDLVDMVIGGGYFQMNPWEELVKLGHEHGVSVYAGLSESRVRGEAQPFRRNSAASYRGRAMRAWQAGVDGIYLFNYFNPRAQFLREIGEPESLQKLGKVYFVTIRNGDPSRYLTDGKRFQTVPILTPQNPLALASDETRAVDILVGDDLAKAVAAGLDPTLTCYALALGADRLAVSLNGIHLESGKASGRWWAWPVKPELVKQGANHIEFSLLAPEGDGAREAPWSVVWTAAENEKPKPPWGPDSTSKRAVAEIEDGALLIADRGIESGDYLYYRYAWNVAPADETVIEARAKVVSGWNNILVCNGVAADRVCLYPDHISLYHSKISCDMDTTDAFHTYRVVMRGEDIRVYVDGELKLDGAGKYNAPVSGGRNTIGFGAANSPSLGEAYWESVKFRTAGASLYDLVLSVRYPQAEE